MNDVFLNRLNKINNSFEAAVNLANSLPILELANKMNTIAYQLQPTFEQVGKFGLEVSEQLNAMSNSVNQLSISPEFISAYENIIKLIEGFGIEESSLAELHEILEYPDQIEKDKAIPNEREDDIDNSNARKEAKISINNPIVMIQFLLSIITFISSLYSGQQDDLRHQQQMLELRKQTEVQEQIQLIQQERLELEKEELVFNKSAQDFLEMFNQQLLDQTPVSDDH